MAFGSRRYLKLAKALAYSLSVHCPTVPRAIVTDSPSEFEHLYDICVPRQPDWGVAFGAKLYLDKYSPFSTTLFIDSDCLVVRSIDHIWDLFAGMPFGVEGHQVTDGVFGGDVATMCRNLGTESIPRFNGGMYYFDDSDLAGSVFATARDMMSRYRELGLEPHARGWSREEPVVALALATHGIRAVDDGGTTMRTPIGLCGAFDIDVLRGYCRFNKSGADVNPAIAHFADWHSRGFYYRREALKLDLARRLPQIRPAAISASVDMVCNPLFQAAQLGRPALPVVKRIYRAWRYRGVAGR